MGQFTKNTFLTFSAQILSVLVGVIASVIIARALGPEGKGIYSLITLIPALALTFSHFGLGGSTVYLIGQKKYSLPIIFGNNLILGIIIGGISSVITAIIVIFIHQSYLSSVPLIYFFIALLTIPLTLICGHYLISILQGLQDFYKYNLIRFLEQIFFLIFVGIALLILKSGVFGTLLGGVLSLLPILVFLFLWLKRSAGQIIYKLNKNYLKDSFFYGIKNYLGNVLGFLHYRIDMLMINAFINPLAVGYYSIAVALAERLWLVSSSIATVIFPKVASERDEKQLKDFTPLVCRNALFILIISAVVLYFLSRWLIIFLFSRAFLPALLSLNLLLPGVVVLGVAQILAHDFSGRGKPIINAYLAGLSVFLNVILNILLIPRFGIAGAALASSISYGAAFIGGILIYHRISGNPIHKIIFIQKSDFKLYKEFFLSLKRKIFRIS